MTTTTDRESAPMSFVRRTLTRIGAGLSSSNLYWAQRVMSQVEAGHWFKAKGYDLSPMYASRQELYAHLAGRFGNERILYLEFGVFQGSSMRSWSGLLKNPQSQLHGFDSFEGLPENWNSLNPAGTFDIRDNIPRFDDPRVTLHVGWFNQTLPTFTLPARDRLVLHIDADLYSSTKYVLDTLKDQIPVGSIVLFDEFYDHVNELKAFDEFLEETHMTFSFLGGATSLSQCAFERIG